MTYLLGIDLGTSAVKALLLDEGGRVLGFSREEYALLTPRLGWVEQDPFKWWRAAANVVRRVISDVEKNSQLAAVGLSGQMHGTVLLDGKKAILNPAVIWPDQRSYAQVEEIKDIVGQENLIEITGSPLATGFQAATIRWFQQNESELWDRVRHVLLPKDYLRWRMTGLFASEASDGSGSLLFDGQARNWSSYLLKILGIDENLLPPIQSSSSVAGELQRESAADLGLPAGVPIITGAADTASSLVGSGALDPGSLVVSISSGGQLVWPSAEFSVEHAGRTHTFCSALEPGSGEAGWYRMGATLSAGQSMRWLRENILVSDGELSFEKMTTWAAEVPIGAHGLFFLPYLSGERSPLMDPHARGVFFGLTLRSERADLVRAVMEGVVFSLYQAYQALVGDGTRPEKIILTGGGARSGFWGKIVADVFGLPVQKLLVQEASTLGAAIIAGAGIGIFDLVKKSRKLARYEAPIEPQISNHTRYKELFEVYCEIYQQNKDIFPRLTADSGKTESQPNSR
jgi:xylulokinase